MKFSKAQLKKMIKETVLEQLGERDLQRIGEIENLMTEVGLTHREMLEDVISGISSETYKVLLKELRNKYGYRI